VLGREPRALGVLDEHFTTELHHSPCLFHRVICVAQSGLELKILLPQSPQVLGLLVFMLTASLKSCFLQLRKKNSLLQKVRALKGRRSLCVLEGGYPDLPRLW
jgi:hypothetical protein